MRALFCLIAFTLVINVFAQVPCNIHGCTYENAVASSSTIMFSSVDYTYSPKCLRVASGTEVTFSGGFSGHPLVSGIYNETSGQSEPFEGTIENTDAGTSASFTMTIAGANPYYCLYHASSGMVGVVYVGDSCATVQPSAPVAPPTSSPVGTPTNGIPVAPTSQNPTASTPLKASSAVVVQFSLLGLFAAPLLF
jgi:plastocyanin